MPRWPKLPLSPPLCKSGSASKWSVTSRYSARSRAKGPSQRGELILESGGGVAGASRGRRIALFVGFDATKGGVTCAATMKNLFSVEGKVALVTGGSRGIGYMIARGFVENGATTYITARKAEACDAAAAELSAFGKCISIPCDVSSTAAVKQLSKTLLER